MNVLRTFNGPKDELMKRLPGRTWSSIRCKRNSIHMYFRDLFTYEEDTLLRLTPDTDVFHYYKTALPNRNPFTCNSRYRHYIAPCIGKGLEEPEDLKVKYENIVQLARNEEELQNLRVYYKVSQLHP